MVYVLTFNILPGKADQFWRFMDRRAAAFWRKFPEVSSVKVFTITGGNRLYEAHIAMPNLAAFERIQKDPEWDRMSKEFLSLVEDLDQHFLTDEREYFELRRAA